MGLPNLNVTIEKMKLNLEETGFRQPGTRLQPVARPRLSTYLNIHGPQLNITANSVAAWFVEW